MKYKLTYLPIYLLFFIIVSPTNFSYAVSFMGKTSVKFSYVKSNVGQVGSSDIKSSVSNLAFDLNLVFNNGVFVGLSGDKDHLFQKNLGSSGIPINDLTSTLGFGVNVGYWNSGFYASVTYLPVVSGETGSAINLAESAALVGQVGLALNLANVIPGIGDWPYIGLGPSFRYKVVMNQGLKNTNLSDIKGSTSGLSLMLDILAVF